MPQTSLEHRKGIFSLPHVAVCLSLLLCLSYVLGQRCFDAVNKPESSHWLIGYNYIIRGSWGMSYGTTRRSVAGKAESHGG